MATTEQKAKNFIREASGAIEKLRKDMGIDHKDVIFSLRVDVQTAFTYSNHEDED